VQGREPQGIVAMADYEDVRNRLAEQLQQLTDPRVSPCR
jgi:predicted AlkP superfamily phosphohydrolase/phosphomutase